MAIFAQVRRAGVVAGVGTLVAAGYLLSCTQARPCAVDAECDDGNVCNGAETCVSGLCAGGIPPDCDDDDPCTSDSCADNQCRNLRDLCPDASATFVYWTEASGADCGSARIRRAEPTGDNIENLLTLVSSDSATGLDVDVLEQRMYWSLSGSSANCDDRIQSVRLDGSDLRDLIIFGEQPTCNSRPSPGALALDTTAGRFYWIGNGGCSPCPSCGVCSVINRANLDGTPTELVLELEGTRNPSGLALDLSSGKVYWTDRQYTPIIWRANLDGSNPEPLVDGTAGATDIALDVGGGTMYWIESGGSIPCSDACAKIRRANLDGSAAEDIVVHEDQPDFDASLFYRGLAVDPEEGKIYWSVSGFCPAGVGFGRIQRADLDGSNVETILSGLGIPLSVAIANRDTP